MILANDADSDASAGDPLDVGLLAYAREQGMEHRVRPSLASAEREGRPFDSAWKYMRTTVESEESASVSYVKGAPKVIPRTRVAHGRAAGALDRVLRSGCASREQGPRAGTERRDERRRPRAPRSRRLVESARPGGGPGDRDRAACRHSGRHDHRRSSGTARSVATGIGLPIPASSPGARSTRSTATRSVVPFVAPTSSRE